MNAWGDPIHHLKRQLDRMHTLPHNYATKSHGLEHHRVPVASECHFDRARYVATQQPGLKPSKLYHFGGRGLLVVCSLHLPKIIEFYLRIQMLPAKYCSWLHFTWTTLYINVIVYTKLDIVVSSK